ncbi:photosystem II assembly protein Psb35 [Nostoc sp.]|uniref:photosystem II assembly protein Psb35 n=1 Tax=Nostoc sp. TaxID=1180 RepID=UPI002FFC8B34
MDLLMQTAAPAIDAAPHFPFAFTLVYVVGFIAAVSIGSIAWYNSKRPAGWESKERPDFVPKVDKEETPGLGEPKSK